MKVLACLMLMRSLVAQDLHQSKNQFPKPIKPFTLEYSDLPPNTSNIKGSVLVQFDIDENGDVIKPLIVDTFNMAFNDVILNKVRQTKYEPALQNGKPIKVRFSLPIEFK